MKEHVVNLFDRTNQNLVIVQDEHGNSFGLQKINRVRKSFDKDKFKLSSFRFMECTPKTN